MTPMNSSTALGPIAAFALVLLLIPAALWLRGFGLNLKI